MDTQDQNKNEDYLKYLPAEVKALLYDGVWEERSIEIAKKYSLSDAQTESLTNLVVQVLVGLENPNKLNGDIVTDLNISKLLAGQITDELDTRVFDYAVKFIEANIKPDVEKTETPTVAPIKPIVDTQDPLNRKPPMYHWADLFYKNVAPSTISRQEKLDIANKTRIAKKTKTPANIPEYVKKIAPQVEDVIFQSNWEEKTSDVAQKYSQNPVQTEILLNSVLLVLVGLEKPEAFLDTLIAELGVSRLVVQQITLDLETRVFEYVLGLVLGKKGGIASNTAGVAPEVKMTFDGTPTNKDSVPTAPNNTIKLETHSAPAAFVKTFAQASQSSTNSSGIPEVPEPIITAEKTPSRLHGEIGIRRENNAPQQQKDINEILKTQQNNAAALSTSQTATVKTTSVTPPVVPPVAIPTAPSKPAETKPEITSLKTETVSVPKYTTNIPTYKPTSEVNEKAVNKNQNGNEEMGEMGGSKINYNSSKVTTETVQKPVPVPRFVASPIQETAPEVKPIPTPAKPIEIPKATPQTLMENKLNSVTKTVQEEGKATGKENKYTVDPYREPLG